MLIRLNKFLSQCGICSRRKADELIKLGKIKINDKIAKLGDKIDPNHDKIEYQGKIIKPIKKSYVYYAINKPVGYISTSDDPHAQKTILELVSKNPRVYPVGRLDKNSQGLMILTNDGNLADLLTHPRYEHEREYNVKCKISLGHTRDKQITIEYIKNKTEKMKSGIKLSEGTARFDKIDLLSFSHKKNEINLQIIMHQGLKRQIRRMCEKVGLEVVKLKRVRIGKLTLDDLKEGKYKIVEKKDII